MNIIEKLKQHYVEGFVEIVNAIKREYDIAEIHLTELDLNSRPDSNDATFLVLTNSEILNESGWSMIRFPDEIDELINELLSERYIVDFNIETRYKRIEITNIDHSIEAKEQFSKFIERELNFVELNFPELVGQSFQHISNNDLIDELCTASRIYSHVGYFIFCEIKKEILRRISFLEECADND